MSGFWFCFAGLAFNVLQFTAASPEGRSGRRARHRHSLRLVSSVRLEGWRLTRARRCRTGRLPLVKVPAQPRAGTRRPILDLDARESFRFLVEPVRRSGDRAGRETVRVDCIPVRFELCPLTLIGYARRL